MAAKKATVFENLAAEYYEDAVSAFLDMADLTRCSPSWDVVCRLNHTLRVCTLFSAFAAEAFVNAFLDLGLGSDTAAELDREPTARKYALATEQAGCEPLDLGRAPLQTVANLFKRRDSLVHPRPRRVEADEYGIRISAKACAQSLLAVADCVLVLNDSLDETDFVGPIERRHDLGDEIDRDWSMIEAERMYFFTGGLIHVIAERRTELNVLGAALEQDPFGGIDVSPIAQAVELGRELETLLEVLPAR